MPVFSAMLKRTADLFFLKQKMSSSLWPGNVRPVPLRQVPVSHVTFLPLGSKASQAGHSAVCTHSCYRAERDGNLHS